MNNRSVIFVIIALITLGSANINCSYGWIAEGHSSATHLAIELASDKLPKFFTNGVNAIAHCSADPDVFKITVEPRQLGATESPEHYIDLEMLNGKELPTTREAFIQLCASNNRSASKVGTLPYSVAEWTQRLTLALAEYRKWPENEIIRAKCLIYAGNLAHYAEDLCMPLHTTVNHDGMVHDINAPSPKTGIHLKTDALIGKVLDCNTPKIQIQPLPDCWLAIKTQLNESHRLIPAVYDLESQLPEVNTPLKTGTKAAAFAKQELDDTAIFTARIFLTAWKDSESVKLPNWHNRPAQEKIIISDEKTRPQQTGEKHEN